MILVEQQIIKSNHPHFNELRELMSVSKSLYNMALYNVRQHYFESKNDDTIKYKFLSYVENWKKLKTTDVFQSLDSHCSQEIIKLVDKSFKSFFTLICKKKQGDYQERCSIPKYKDKKSYCPLIFPQFPKIKNGVIKVPKSKMTFKTKVENVKQFRFINNGNHIVLEVLYEVEEKELLPDNNRYAAIDLGIDNLCSVSSNCCNSFIINGKPIKSINQYYNKKKGKLQKRVKKCQNKNKSKRITRLTGKRNNQKFVGIPFNTLLDMLHYKCNLVGINVIVTEESYTSKCSFIDNEEIKKKETYLGKRIKRGLYRSKDGRLINADINGSYNIMRKGLVKASLDGKIVSYPECRGFVCNPDKFNLR